MGKGKIASVATALALTSLGAMANQTYTLQVQGSGTAFFYGGYPGECDPGVSAWPDCQRSIGPVDWTGDLTITTSSQVTGTYTGAELLSVSFASNLGSFDYHWGDTQQTYTDFETGQQYTLGMAPGTYVSIADNRITDVGAFYSFVTGGFAMSGLQASELDASGGARSDRWNVTGDVISQTTPIPEPTAIWMIAAGLVGLATRVRRATPA